MARAGTHGCPPQDGRLRHRIERTRSGGHRPGPFALAEARGRERLRGGRVATMTAPLARPAAFRGFRFPPDLITLTVRWYLRYNLSYRDLEVCTASQARVLEARVKREPCRAQGPPPPPRRASGSAPAAPPPRARSRSSPGRVPPAPATLPAIVRSAAAPADPAAPSCRPPRPYPHHQGVAVEHQVRDDGVLDAEHPAPYSSRQHAVPPSLRLRPLRGRNRRWEAACPAVQAVASATETSQEPLLRPACEDPHG
jgi:hypothetical protein